MSVKMVKECPKSRARFFKPYQRAVVCAGGLIYLISIYQFDPTRFDLHFVILVGLTLLLSSRIIISIPRFSSQISVSDTFIFLTMLLYGGKAATLLAATEALLSTLRFSRKLNTILFNWSCAALSTYATSQLLRISFGDIVSLPRSPFSLTFICVLTVLALAQYAFNSGIVAIAAALKTDQPLWQTWKRHYLWTSITYFAGASAAGLVAKLVAQVGFYALVVTAPIVAIVYFTYRTYLKNVEASAIQAEQAERHVEELSHYIAEQERIREQFTQVEKLSALGELASGVAHDFNNTLAGILGRAQLLLRTDDPEKIKRGLNIIIKTAEDGAKTVKRIQDFARQRRDHDFELVSIDQILLDVSEMTRPLWKDKAEAANVHYKVDLRIRSNSKVMGDQSELREVLINMVFNALDAMPQGGQLVLSAEDLDDQVVISVADTGGGMSSEVRSRIFDPFFTTKGKAGLGLGLAVSFGILRRHEANIEVDSEVGKGTTFRISLPIARPSVGLRIDEPEQKPVQLKESDPDDFKSRDRPRILVVDDEEYVRDLLRDLLEDEGCAVTLASSGREAFSIFQIEELDAVFTDVGMPGMSGWELAHAIREQDADIPIAVITGWGEAVGSVEQKEAAVDWVITKPFTADRIVQLSKEIIETRKSKTVRSPLSTAAV